MTSVNDFANYYAALLIKQYFTMPKAMATINLLASGMCCDLVFTAVSDAYNINTAEGVQLDVIGKWVGVPRFSRVIGGVNQIIDDGDYRTAIQMKIIKNNCVHSQKSIDDFLFRFFPTRVIATNNEDMTMTYEYALADDDLMHALLTASVLPEPSCVGVLLAPTLNPNGEFGYSSNGIADSYVNGYGSTEDEAVVDETQTSTTTTKVAVMYAPLSVAGVWLASDPGHAGTNYYSGGIYAGSVLTLGTPLPGATTAVLVNYSALHGGTYLQMGS